MKYLRNIVAGAAVGLLAFPAVAGTFSGVISNQDGEPMHGVMVRVSNDSSYISESVYSNPQGVFTLETVLVGKLDVRLRTPYFRDQILSVELSSNGSVEKNLQMTAMETDQEISDSLPAGYHYGNLPFETGEGAVFNRYQFQRDCLSCHQLGNEYTRSPKPAAYWLATIIRMHRYMGGYFDGELRERRAEILSAGFDGAPLSVRPEFPVDARISDAKITEYRLDRGNPHDTIIHPDTGVMFSADQGGSFVTVTDPMTGESTYLEQKGELNKFYVPGTNKKEVEVFSETVRNTPHSLALGKDGKYYITNSAANTIGVLDPQTLKFDPSYVIGAGVNYPHTIRVDDEGIVWFTISGAEHLGRLDPKTGDMKVLALGDAKSGGVSRGTWPYGIDINPTDGSVWYSRLFADEIGRIDPDTLEITRFKSPMRGPRRMAFDDSGVLWVTGYSEGTLAAVTPTREGNKVTIESKVWDMPEFAKGYRPAPYALGVHPDTQEIWVNENMTDRMYRFIPFEERWVVYPTPLRGSYSRDIDFAPDGKACASNNPYPLRSLEYGTSEIFCIELMSDKKLAAN